MLFICIYIPAQSFAKDDGRQMKIDSMLNVLAKTTDDTNKVNLLLELSGTYRAVSSAEAIKYGRQGLELAARIKFRDGMSNANYIIGNIYIRMSEPDSALGYYFASLKLEKEKEKEDKQSTSALFMNIGTAYFYQSNYPRALEYLFQALKLFEENGNKRGLGNCLNNISNIYYAQKDYANTLVYDQKALALFQSMDKKEGVAMIEGNIGSLYAEQADYVKALPYFTKALEMYTLIGDSEGIARNLGNFASLYQKQSDYTKALENFYKALGIDRVKEFVDAEGIDFSIGGEIYLAIASDSTNNPTTPVAISKSSALKLAKSYTDSSITVFKKAGDLKSMSEAYKRLSTIQQLQGDYKGAYDSHVLFKQLNDSVFNLEKDKKITQTSMQYEFDKKEAVVKSEQEKRDIRQRNIRNSIAAGLAGALVFALVVFRQRNKISKEKKRSDELLLNILPGEVAEELKAKGSADAKQFDEVTVMFTDFKGFTQISEKLTPAELVAEIDTCFKAFDHIITKYNIEKIKTIGDAYMCAGGLPVANKTNAADVVQAGIEIRDFMMARKSAIQNPGMTGSQAKFEIRIGIHTGPVVAGIVGVKKFAYDIWGDTVNIASRMESSGEAGKVNISGSTYALLKGLPEVQAGKFSFVYRGKIQAKNKGEIDMYFVN